MVDQLAYLTQEVDNYSEPHWLEHAVEEVEFKSREVHHERPT